MIEQNLFIDTLGYNVQIKHQLERPAGIGMPAQATRTVLRHNLFTKANNASTGTHARPNLLLGHFPRQGAGSNDTYEVTHNLFVCNPRESLLQAEGNLSIARNIFVNPVGDAISIQPHHDIPKNVDIRQNFVAASGKGVSIPEAPSSYTQSVTANWIYAPAAATGGKQSDNQIAPFNLAEPALARWLGLGRDTASRIHEFAPLIEVAHRVCVNRKEDNALRDHPMCQIVTQLSAAINKRTVSAATAASAAHWDADRCEWK